MAENMRKELLNTPHAFMNQAAGYFFQSHTDGGKKVRPVMAVLLSRAVANHAAAGQPQEADGTSTVFSKPLDWQRPDLPYAKRRMAQVSEMIHTASLFHDDVLDKSDTRRGVPSVHKVYSNKVAILAGDFLLSQSIVGICELRNVDVLEAVSKTVSDLVAGELLQMRGTNDTERATVRLVHYLRKTYYKTASLMANACKSIALLGGYDDELVAATYNYGKYIGIAFQLEDDILDYSGISSALGKPSQADLKAGLATASVLFAAEEFPALNALIDRKFSEEDDADEAFGLVLATNGLERTKKLAQAHAEAAMDAVLKLEPSLHRDALVHLAMKVVDRTS